MNPRRVRAIFERFARANPNPTTELHYRSPFELLVAVMLSAQSTDAAVNRVTEKLFAVADTPEAILALGRRRLETYLKTLGLYRSKAANLIETCRLLIERHGGQVPCSREALEALPGVGRKTANVVLNTVCGEPVIAVDTHVFRVANRTGLAPGRTVREVEEKLYAVIPERYLRHAHHWLVLHGRYICTARKPRCGACLISDLCEYPHKTDDA